MKTISLRELRHNAGKWMRRVVEEKEIIVTDRGIAIAKVIAPDKPTNKRKTRANRTLLPAYAAALKAGKLKTTGDSTAYISEDRSSRDNSVAGIDR